MAVGAHGADHRQTGRAGRKASARHGKHGIKIDRPESFSAASDLDGGAECDEHVIYGRCREVVERIRKMQHQPGVLLRRCAAAHAVNRRVIRVIRVLVAWLIGQ
jgi:hypothetical protein